MILDHGFYTGFTLYPNTKVSRGRAVDMIEKYGPDRHYRQFGVRLGAERTHRCTAANAGDAPARP